MPGTLVAMGRNSPRNSAGASGLRSKVSMVLRPPCRKRKMSDRSLVARPWVEAWACSCSRSGSVTPMPKMPAAPMRKKSRRCRPSQNFLDVIRTPLSLHCTITMRGRQRKDRGTALRKTPPPNPLPATERGRRNKAWSCSPSPLRGGGWGEGFSSEPRRCLPLEERHLEDLLVHDRTVSEVAALAEQLPMIGGQDDVRAARALCQQLSEQTIDIFHTPHLLLVQPGQQRRIEERRLVRLTLPKIPQRAMNTAQPRQVLTGQHV